MIDIDYLVDHILKEQESLDIKTIQSSKTHYLIPALNRQTGKIDYFSNKDDTIDIFEAMRATKAMPIAFKLSPNISINKNTYCDSCLSSYAETHIKKAIDIGAKKILIINSSPKPPTKNLEDKLFDFWISVQNESFKKGYFQFEKEIKNYQPDKRIKIFEIKPEKPLLINTLTHDKKLLEQTIQQGYNETCSNEKLIKFLGINFRYCLNRFLPNR